MTLDEAIKRAEEVAEECQRVVDTGIIFDGVTIDMLYCDDTEVMDEYLANYRRFAEEQRQLAKWLKDYKRLIEQEPVLDKIRAEIEEYKSRQLRLAIGVADLEKGKQIAIEYILAILNEYDAESEG